MADWEAVLLCWTVWMSMKCVMSTKVTAAVFRFCEERRKDGSSRAIFCNRWMRIILCNLIAHRDRYYNQGIEFGPQWQNGFRSGMLTLKNGWLVLIQAEPIDTLFCMYPNDRVQLGHVVSYGRHYWATALGILQSVWPLAQSRNSVKLLDSISTSRPC